MFAKVLIADRGEVVFRVARTCERMGIATVSVQAESETEAPSHTTACDEVVRIGPEVSAYADPSTVIAAAQHCGAQAIHPGYGRLSQDPEAARAISAAGLTFIAPPADLTLRLRDPLACREIALLAGVRALPLTRLDSSDPSEARARANDLGYPLWISPLTGSQPGVSCEDEDELEGALQHCRAAAGESSRDGLWLERLVHDPRVLAVQLLGDGVEQVALGDLERSIVLIAESPAPALAPHKGRGLTHKTLCDAALRVAREAGLVGPGIAEFLLDRDGRLFFTQLRAGLPPEHALAELCCNLDLVEIQLRIAAGEPLPAEGRRAQPTGHAAEARVHAVPPPGAQGHAAAISMLRWPMVAPGCLRLETELAVGHRPMLDGEAVVAKIAAYGQTRHQALLTLDRVLAEATIAPLATNLDFLRRILADESFRAGQYDSGFADRLLAEPPRPA